MDEGLQVLIPVSQTLVAGLPPALRSAHRAAAEAPGARVYLAGVDDDQARRYSRQLAALPGYRRLDAAAPDGAPDPKKPLLTLQGDGFPAPGALGAFLAHAAQDGRPAAWLCAGRAVAAYYPAAEQAGEQPAFPRDAGASRESWRSHELPGWLEAGSPEQAAEAERSLFAALPKDTDGYIARFDRRLSMALSAGLLKLPITPNDITTASLILGLLGAWWLASGRYELTVAGAALLWLCCLLDGCDGEVARLKLLCTPSGAAYDLAADHVAHLATFVAIPFGVHRAFPGASFKLPGVLLVSGFLACMFSVWYLVLRKPESERGRHSLLIERVASRDYVYLIALLAVLGRLDWFLYAAGVGSHIFWAALWLIA